MGENWLGFQFLLHVLGFYMAISLLHCDATSQKLQIQSPSTFKLSRKSYLFNRFSTYMPLDSSNTDPYVSSPFSLPPYESLPPISLPENTPPYCVYPPPTSGPPFSIPSPTSGYTPPSPPTPSSTPTSPSPTTSGPPTMGPGPTFPSPPNAVPYPPSSIPSPSFGPPYYEPSPPGSTSSPPYNIPSPSVSVPSPRFLPPIVFPPPAVPPPPHRTPAKSQWCVAKASVPDPIIEEAMNYACGSGADCDQIQPSGSCFQPNTLFAHASYAFNSYWQRSKLSGGTCDFGGTAILVTVDPSYDGCHFTIA